MKTIGLSFRFEGRSLGTITVTHADLQKGYGAGESSIDRNFAQFYHDMLLEYIDSGEYNLAAELDTVPHFQSLPFSDLQATTSAFSLLYEAQKDKKLGPQFGLFHEEVLKLTRNLFKSLTDLQKRILLLLADYLGNERVVDALSYIYAQYLEDKTSEQVRAVLQG